jgi:hypothetical protein
MYTYGYTLTCISNTWAIHFIHALYVPLFSSVSFHPIVLSFQYVPSTDAYIFHPVLPPVVKYCSETPVFYVMPSACIVVV